MHSLLDRFSFIFLYIGCKHSMKPILSSPPATAILTLRCISLYIYIYVYIKILFIYFWRGEKRGKETSMCGCLSHTCNWGPGTRPRHVPRLGIEPATLWFAGWCSVHEPRQPGLRCISRAEIGSVPVQEALSHQALGISGGSPCASWWRRKARCPELGTAQKKGG